MAFLLFYLRFATKLFRTLVFCTIGLNTIFTAVQWLLYCLQCIPIDAFFHKAAHPNISCVDNSVLAFLPAALVCPPANFFSFLPANSIVDHLHGYLHRCPSNKCTVENSGQTQ